MALGAVFSDTLSPTIFASVVPVGSAVSAMQAFSIQELLEHIVTYLPFTDLLSFEQVNKEIRDAVTKSAHLSRHFDFSLSDGASPWVLGTIGPSYHDREGCPIDIHYCENPITTCFECRPCEKKTYTPEDGLMLHAVIRGPVKLLPSIGERGMSRLICQPPITMMTYGIYYDGRGDIDEQMVQNESGLTLGDLYTQALAWANSPYYNDEAVWRVQFRAMNDEERKFWLDDVEY